MRFIYPIFISSILLVTSCIKNPVTGEKEIRLISENQERQIGTEAYKTMAQAQGGHLIIDEELTAYVNSVGQRLAAQSDRPTLSYEFIIINDSIPNAWALPGGKIAINRGLLTELQSEAELAAVLGHEIVHAAARHGAKGMERGMLLQGGLVALGVATQNSQYNDMLVDSASIGANLIMSRYSRKQELESDRYGMMYMAKAGYNPEAAIRLQELFLSLSKGQNDWLSGLFASHPPSQERITANQATILTVDVPNATFEGKEEYQKKVAFLISKKEAYKAYDDGVKAIQEKAYTKALTHANEAILSFKDEAIFYGLKGYSLQCKKQPRQAIEAYTEAIEKNPNYFEFYLQRAISKKMIGDYKGSEKDAKRSIELLPTGEAHELLGKLAYQNGNRKLAIHHFQIASHAHSPAGQRSHLYLMQLLQSRS